MRKLKWLDLYCGGGGSGKGLLDAGLDVTGVDIDPLCKKWYPGKFVQHDVLTIESLRQLDGTRFIDQFDGFSASPVCRRFSTMTKIRGDPASHPDQIAATREILQRTGKPYFIENVPEAPLRKDLELCGLMFGLPLYRHRIFECSFPVAQPIHPRHDGQQQFSVVGRLVSTKRKGGPEAYQKMKASWPIAMGITHINVNASTTDGHNMFSQAIPPAFSKYIIEQFLEWRRL